MDEVKSGWVGQGRIVTGEEILREQVADLTARLAKIEAHFKLPEPDPEKAARGDGGDVRLIPGKPGIGANGRMGRPGCVITYLPLSDPDIDGALWSFDGTVRVSGREAPMGFPGVNPGRGGAE